MKKIGLGVAMSEAVTADMPLEAKIKTVKEFLV